MSVVVHPAFRHNLGDIFGGGAGQLIDQTLQRPVLPVVTGGEVLKYSALALLAAYVLKKLGGSLKG